MFALFLALLALLAPAAARAGDVDPGVPVTVTPPYDNAEYRLEFRLPPSGWRAVRAAPPPWPEDGIVTALQNDVTGALGWVRIIPRDRGDLRTVLAWVQQHFGIDAPDKLVFDGPAQRITFSSYRNGYSEFHHIRRDLAMTNSYAWFQMSARPIVGAEAARKAFDFMVASISARETPAKTAVGALASCLNRRGVSVYAAWWCPACKKAFEPFGPEITRLNRHECSDEGSREVRQFCMDEEVPAFPAWSFADGRMGLGIPDLGMLAKAAGCPYAPPAAPDVKAPVPHAVGPATPPKPTKK